MCLALFRFAPHERWPFLLVSIRDEELARPTAGPEAWWPQTHPGLVGGRDLRSGGTWLAVDPRSRSVAAVFTPGGGPSTADAGMRTRGELPLMALAGDAVESLDLHRYLPFALLRADATHAFWWSWNGSDLERTPVAPGLHVGNIDGLDAAERSPRQARWLPAFSAAPPLPFDPSGDVRQRWQGWLELLDGGLEPERADALLLRRSHAGQAYGTKSVALVAIAPEQVLYDVNDQPGDATSWTSVDVPA